MNTLYVVACGTQQRTVRLPAAQLYIGALFSTAITHARRFAKREQDVRILSAKHGLMSQGRLIEPYEFDLGQLDDRGLTQLVTKIRSELPRGAVLPLRIVMLAPDEYVELFQMACVGTPFEKVPLRTPLAHLNTSQQLQWMQAAKWPIECQVGLPVMENLYPPENEQLQASVCAAALWWSEQLMGHSPPPEPTLFANALALELYRAWDETASKSRGEWPEDINFSITYQHASEEPIAAAFRAIGLDPQEWWKREWGLRPLTACMRFSMALVTVESHDMKTTIFQS
ncbi:hypothetical protein IAD21_02561 [Abditibacteriota bacterium]|nr:hypothetical protein IAD21_02561 [Abditibacteriota bacterium]